MEQLSDDVLYSIVEDLSKIINRNHGSVYSKALLSSINHEINHGQEQAK